MANGIGRVWAANAGDDEQRPNGVGSVWIENIDALAPSGGASEQQINELSAAIDYVSANAGGESNVVTDNGEFTVLPNTLGTNVTIKYPTDEPRSEASGIPFHDGEWYNWEGNSGADPNNTGSYLAYILHYSDTTPINLEGKTLQVTLPHTFSGVGDMQLRYLTPNWSSPLGGPNATDVIQGNNNTYSAGKYVFNCVGNPYSAHTGTYGCYLALSFSRREAVYGPSSIDASFETLEYGPVTGYEVDLNRYVPSSDGWYIGVGVNTATKQPIISATNNLTTNLKYIYPTWSSVSLNSATWNTVTDKQDTLTFGYDEQNNISAINNSAIGGGGIPSDLDLNNISANNVVFKTINETHQDNVSTAFTANLADYGWAIGTYFTTDNVGYSSDNMKISADLPITGTGYFAIGVHQEYNVHFGEWRVPYDQINLMNTLQINEYSSHFQTISNGLTGSDNISEIMIFDENKNTLSTGVGNFVVSYPSVITQPITFSSFYTNYGNTSAMLSGAISGLNNSFTAYTASMPNIQMVSTSSEATGANILYVVTGSN